MNEFKIKNGAIISGSITGITEPAQENSTKMASTAWVVLQNYLKTIPAATASVIGGIKVGAGLTIDGNGVLTIPGAAEGTLRTKQSFTATAGQTTFTITGGYTAGLIDIYLNGVFLTGTSVTASNGTTVVLTNAAEVGDILDVTMFSVLNTGFVSGTTDNILEGTTNLYFTNTRARAAISLTTTGTSGAATYNSTTGVLNIPAYQGGVISFNTRTGAITLSSGDITTALGYTPYNSTNPSGYTTNTGTVTSVAALTIGTTGTDITSSVATGTTTAVITLNVPTASAANRGALSAADWTTFNGKQPALNGTGFVKISGTTISYDNSAYYLASNPSGYTNNTGTVTTVSVTTANGVSGSVATAGTTPAITLTLGAITPTSVNGLTFTAAATGFTIAGGTTSKTLTLSNTLTFAGTDSSTLNIEAGGTLGSAAFTASTAYQASNTNLTSLAGLTFASTSFVKMTAAGTFALDTNTYYLASNPSGYTNNTGTVTTVSVTTANGVSGSVATAGTTPAITLTLGAITPTSVNSVVISGSTTPTLAVAGTSSISGSNTGDNAVNSLYSGLVSNATHTGDATGATALTVVGLRGVALPSLGATAGNLRYTGTGTNTWILDSTTYLTANQSISVTGDVTGTGSTAIALTLANSGVTVGTYTKVTVDAKGRVTVGASLASSDLPAYTGTITSSQVTTALGFTPYNSTNPAGYTTNTGAVTSVSGTGTVSGLTLSGTVTTSGSLTLGGTLSLTSGNVTTALGFTPYNSTNPNSYVALGSAITGYTVGANTALAATDSILGAFNKIQGQLNGKQASGSYLTSYTETSTLANVTARGATTNGAITVNGDITISAGTSSNIYMSDTDEGQRQIHCNSNRIGFLTQVQGWGSYCNDDGSWVSVSDITAFSDARIKENIVTVDNALEKVLQLRGVYYNRTDISDKSKKIGVIAQETQAVLPEVVHEEVDGMLGVAYGNMGGLFIEAFKEQQVQLTQQKAQINELMEIVKTLKGL